MSEMTFTFGRSSNLCGTLTRPDGPATSVAILLLNAGVIHRVGPHRVNVRLARDLARHGFHCFRFDISGLGDSSFSSRPQASYQEQARADIVDAMHAVTERTGISRFALFGICSGAQNGLSAAEIDPRLAGLFMVDGYAYATPRTRWQRGWIYLRRQPLLYAARWLWSRARSAFGRPANGTDESVEIDYGQNTPPKHVFARTITELVARDVRIACLFTGSWIDRYSYRDQWRDGFKDEAFVDKVQIGFEPSLDHTASTLAGQRVLIDEVRAWAIKEFG